MLTERFDHGCDSLLDAIELARAEGYSVEFTTNNKGFYNTNLTRTYLPESIRTIETIRLDAPYAEPDVQRIVYLLEMMDGQKGWISDASGPDADVYMVEHITRVKENFAH